MLNQLPALHILYHHRTMGRGAEGVHITSIVKALQTMGHTVTVISPPGIDPMKDIGAAPIDKSKVKTRGIQSFWKLISKYTPNFIFELAEISYNFAALRRLNRELATKKYDLIYERYAFYLFAGIRAAKKHGIPLVLEANEVSGIKRARKQSFQMLCRFFERAIFKRSTGILTVSSYLKNKIVEQGINAKKIFVVPNAIDLNAIRAQKKEAVLVARYQLADKLVIGFAGWFDHWDRLELLIEAFRVLKKTHANIVVLLIGDGPVLVGIKKLIASYGLEQDVVFTGPVKRSEIAHYLALLDIAVLPHSNEFGSPVVMFEFMALQIPIVAPRLAPIEDVLEHEKTALLFTPLNLEQCIKAIRQFVDTPALRQQIATQAFAKLSKEHTWTNNAKKIIQAAEFECAAEVVLESLP